MKRKANPLNWWKLHVMEESLPRLQSLPSELSVWTPAQPALRVHFLRGCFRCYPAERGHHSSKSTWTWCDLVSQPEYGSSANIDHPRLAVQQEVIGDGQMSWKFNQCIVQRAKFARPCQCLGLDLWVLTPPPPPLSLSLPPSVSLSLSLSPWSLSLSLSLSLSRL